MTENHALIRASQSLEPGDKVELYMLDLAPLGFNEIWRFCSSSFEESRLRFQGFEYAPVDVESEGWEMTGQGAFPRPKLRVSNVFQFFNGLLIEHKDAVGARLIRLRTYRQFLDGQPEADPDAFYDPDIYNVERKLKHNKTMIEWELSAAADQAGVMIPRRKLYRDTCTHTYRTLRPDGGWDYSDATCPYTEQRYYDKFDQPTNDIKKDDCSLTLRGCRLRFKPTGSPDAVLPMQAFPGLIRTTTA